MDGEYWNGIAMPIVGVAPWLRLNAIPIRTIHKHFRVSGMDSFKRPTFLRSFPLSLSPDRIGLGETFIYPDVSNIYFDLTRVKILFYRTFLRNTLLNPLRDNFPSHFRYSFLDT